jgi:AraC-like DNA-binding protein
MKVNHRVVGLNLPNLINPIKLERAARLLARRRWQLEMEKKKEIITMKNKKKILTVNRRVVGLNLPNLIDPIKLKRAARLLARHRWQLE